LDSSRASEDLGDLQKGDLYVGHFGYIMLVKKENTLRLGFQNIGGFPTQRGKLKEDNIRLGITKRDFDIFGMAEVNIDWRLMKEQDRLPTRTKEWWTQQHVFWAHNRISEPSLPRQFGGTAIFSVDKAAHRAIEKGANETNLGRWAWTRYKGKGNQTLRMITAYRPNPPQGPFTVYAQQNAFFHTIQRDICPRQAFLLDLRAAITQFMEAGDHIILMIGGNLNMKCSDLCTTLSQLSLRRLFWISMVFKVPQLIKRIQTMLPSTVPGFHRAWI
jgi:hypothetical protein